MTPSLRALILNILFSSILGWLGFARAAYLESSPECREGEYWCQDRCGSDEYGHTCCETPDGQHNLCGTGTECCLYGCCPSGTECNDVGACVHRITVTDEGGETIVSSTTVEPGDGLFSSLVASESSVFESSLSASSASEDQDYSPPPLSTTASEPTDEIDVPSDSLTVAPGSSVPPESELPAPSASEVPQPEPPVPPSSVAESLSGDQPIEPSSATLSLDIPASSNLEPPVPSASSDISTFTDLDGLTVIVIGTESVTLPEVSASSVITTHGHEITLHPPVPSGSESVSLDLPISEDPGPSGSESVDLPLVPDPSDSVPAISSDTESIVDPPGSGAISSSTIELTESGFAPSDSLTGSLSVSLDLPITSSVGIFEDPSSLVSESSSEIVPVVPSETSVDPSQSGDQSDSSTPDSTGLTSPTASEEGDEDLPVYTAWPPEAIIAPVTTSVERPRPTDDGTVIPCNLWFFSICIDSEGIAIGGWILPLPPGIYPPGPPPGAIFPPGIVASSLPPWPSITIGQDNLPTYSDEPTSCETETASLCVTTTSFGESVSGEATITTATEVLSTCDTVYGCNVQDEDEDDAITSTESCSHATVTDVWVSCPGSASASCITTSTSLVSGCDVTPTTIACTRPSASGLARRADGDDSDDECGAKVRYVVYPTDGTDQEQTDKISDKLKEFANEDDIYTSDTRTIGINFWLVDLTESQFRDVLETLDDEVASMYPPSAIDTVNIFTADDRQVTWQPNAPVHLVRMCQAEGHGLEEYENRYFFEYDREQIPGDDIPVYVLDSGAQIDHKEFEKHVRDKVRWIHVGRDIGLSADEDNPEDDSQTDPSGEWVLEKAHGTAMLSLVTGELMGVSKGVQPTLVRMPRRKTGEGSGGATFEDWIEGLSRINDDLEGSSDETSAIILMATFFPRRRFQVQGQDQSAGFSGRMRQLLQDLVSKGALPITGAGNAGSTTIDGWPAAFGDVRDSPVEELLVVGAIDAITASPYYNRDDEKGLPHVRAPGVSLKVADGNKGLWGNENLADDGYYRDSKGTSDAAALTVGLAAYYLKLARAGYLQIEDTSPQGLRDYIISDERKWLRPTTETLQVVNPEALWNGVPWPGGNCEAQASQGLVLARQEDAETSAAVCALPSFSLSISHSASVSHSDPSVSASDSGTPSASISDSEESGSLSGGVTITASPPTTFETSLSEITDFPDLTGTVVSSPSGSTCLSTVTYSTCQYPGGRGPVCVDATECATWAPKSTSSPEPEPTGEPLKLGKRECYDRGHFGSIGDIDKGRQQAYARDFCNNKISSDIFSEGDENEWHRVIVDRFFSRPGVYIYELYWADDCELQGDKQEVDIKQPIPDNEDITCYSLLVNNYVKCNNGGIGGYVQVGCLVYHFRSASY